MERLLLVIIFFTSNICLGQIKSVVKDSETDKELGYVNIWVKNENNGTTSSVNGRFKLEVEGSKIIQFSAVGYKTKTIYSDSIKSVVKLTPSITKLEEVFLKTKIQSKKRVVGNYNRSKINQYFGTGTKPWISARYFDYREGFSETPFLSKIKVLTNSDIKNAKFNVRFYGVGNNGQPKNLIFNKPIFGIAKKGKKNTEIDISDLNIQFPKSGFFIAFEWLIIERNKHEYSYTNLGSNKKLIGISYEPAFGTIPANTDENSWIFEKGTWRKMFKNSNEALKRYKNKYDILAIELTLTD